MSEQGKQIIAKWYTNLVAFAVCFMIANKRNETVKFTPSRPQRTMFEILMREKRVLILKGRQMWITTSVAIYALWLCLFKPGSRVAVATQADHTAKEICKFYIKLYRGNALLMQLLPLGRDPSEHAMVFENGSQILFGTANTGFWRGQPTQLLHLTEASDYDDLGQTLAAAGESVDKECQIIIESTGQAENDFCEMWRDERSSYYKRFLCWLDHDEYRSDKPIRGTLDEVEAAYLKKHAHRMTKEQAQFWVDKYRSQAPAKRHLVFCEYPSTPEEAFLASGARWLRRAVPTPPARAPDDDGTLRIYSYNPQHQYSAGIDVSAGSSDGDYSTVVIGDITTRKVVATMQVRMPVREFRHFAKKLLNEYHDPITAVEVNFDGRDLATELREDGIPQYRMPDFGGTSTELKEQHGWRTDSETRPILFGGMYDAVCVGDPWEVGCFRLVSELNALCYRKAGQSTRPDHPKNGHSDLAVAFGLMIQAISQAYPPEERPKPVEKVLTPLQLHEQILETGAAPAFFGDNLPVQRGDFFD